MRNNVDTKCVLHQTYSLDEKGVPDEQCTVDEEYVPDDAVDDASFYDVQHHCKKNMF